MTRNPRKTKGEKRRDRELCQNRGRNGWVKCNWLRANKETGKRSSTGKGQGRESSPGDKISKKGGWVDEKHQR